MKESQILHLPFVFLRYAQGLSIQFDQLMYSKMWRQLYLTDIAEPAKNELSFLKLQNMIEDAIWMNVHVVPVPVFEIRVRGGYGARWSLDGSQVCAFVSFYRMRTVYVVFCAEFRTCSCSHGLIRHCWSSFEAFWSLPWKKGIFTSGDTRHTGPHSRQSQLRWNLSTVGLSCCVSWYAPRVLMDDKFNFGHT